MNKNYTRIKSNKLSNGVKFYDTTLRDGAQMEGISLSVEDKLRIVRKLDEFGIHYIEGGFPGSNPKDIEFFKRAKKLRLKRARLAAFGMTRRAKHKPQDDPNLLALVKSGAPVITLVGKSWDFHVTHALKTTLKENLRMIADSVRFLKAKHREVIFDAEHFFDGYKRNPDYALATVKTAEQAGADTIVLCDTNGGSLPDQITQISCSISKIIKTPLGIHAHNDADLAVANTLAAFQAGATHIQGTINGYGERCGNANLCSIIPTLKLKLKLNCVTDQALVKLTELSRFVSEEANLHPNDYQPYVGRSAFVHKGGLHLHAVTRHPQTYEHVRPKSVGNARRSVISELSGQSNILLKAREYNISLPKDSPKVKRIMNRLRKLEHQGYQFEGAEGSFELLMKEQLGLYKKLFNLEGFRVIIEKRGRESSICEASIKVKVRGQEVHTAAEGDGPIHAIDNAFRKALQNFYPELAQIKLTDFKVRVINTEVGTSAKVRVLIESRKGEDYWSTIGVSENIIEASWEALVDSIEYGLMLTQPKQKKK